MGVHQWHVQAGHSQLWLNLVPTLVGRGGHSEGHCMMKYGGRAGRSWGWREQSSLPPAVSFMPVWQTSKHRTVDVNHWTSSRWVFRPPQPVELQHVSLLRAGRPIRRPCLPLADLHDAGSPHSISTLKTNSWPTPLIHSLLRSPPFFTYF